MKTMTTVLHEDKLMPSQNLFFFVNETLNIFRS